MKHDGSGHLSHPGFLYYRVLGTKDAPKVNAHFIETDEPNGPFGAKGVGEPPYSVPAPAIANAIYNAIGVRFNKLPINGRLILEGLKELKA